MPPSPRCGGCSAKRHVSSFGPVLRTAHGATRTLFVFAILASIVAVACGADTTPSAALDAAEISLLRTAIANKTPLADDLKAQIKALLTDGAKLVEEDDALREALDPVDVNQVQTIHILHVCSYYPQLFPSYIGVNMFVDKANELGGIKFGTLGITYNFTVTHVMDAPPAFEAWNFTRVKEYVDSGKYDFMANCLPMNSQVYSAMTEDKHMIILETNNPFGDTFVRPGTKDKYKYRFGVMGAVDGSTWVRMAKLNGCTKLGIATSHEVPQNIQTAEFVREAAKVVGLDVGLYEVMNSTSNGAQFNLTKILTELTPKYAEPTLQRMLDAKVDCFYGAFINMLEPTMFDYLVRKHDINFKATFYTPVPQIPGWQDITAYNITKPDGTIVTKKGSDYLFSSTFWVYTVPYTCPLFGDAKGFVQRFMKLVQTGKAPLEALNFITAAGAAAPIYVWSGMQAISQSVDRWRRGHKAFTEKLARAISDLTGENFYGPIKFNIVGQNFGSPGIFLQNINGTTHVVTPPELRTADPVFPVPTWQARAGCPEGTFNDGHSCVPCPLQSFSNTHDARSCTPCPIGSGHSADLSPGQTTCPKCPAGWYSSSEGAGCTPCKVGFEQPHEGSDMCVPCLPGFFASETGTTKCSKCAVGTYTEESGSSKCLQCLSGMYRSENLDPVKCYRCPAGSFQPQPGQASCETCPEGMVTAETGSDGLDQCVCPDGMYWNRQAYTCSKCGLGTLCDWSKYKTASTPERRRLGSSTYTRPEGFASWTSAEQKTYLKKLYTAQELPAGLSLPEIVPGYYAEKVYRKDVSDFSSPDVWKCQLQLLCPGGAMVFETAEAETEAASEDFDLAGSLCAFGFSDIGCSRCRDGWGMDGKACVKCDGGSSIGPLVFTPIVLVVIAPILYLFFNIKESSELYDTLSIGLLATQLLSFIQGINVFSSLNVSWQGVVYDISDAFSFLKFDFKFLSSGCSLSTPEKQYFITLFFPVFVSIAILFVYALSHLLVKTSAYKSWQVKTLARYEAQDAKAGDSVAVKSKGLCGRVRKFFTMVHRRCASGLMCFDRTFNTVGYVINAFYVSVCVNCFIPLHTYGHPNGATTLVSYPYIETGTEQWRHMMVMGAIGLFVYIGLWMSYLTYCTYYAPERSAKSAGFLNRFGFLIPNFRPDVWWWGLVTVVRSLVLSIIPLLGENDGQVQTTLVSLVLVIFCCAHMRFWPFKSWVNNVLDCGLCCVLLLVGAAGMWYAERIPNSKSFFDGYIIFMFVVALVLLVVGFSLAMRETLPSVQNKIENDTTELSSELFTYMNKMTQLSPEEVRTVLGTLVPHDRSLIKNCFQLFAQEFLLLKKDPVAPASERDVDTSTVGEKSALATPNIGLGRRSIVLDTANRRIVTSTIALSAAERSKRKSTLAADEGVLVVHVANDSVTNEDRDSKQNNSNGAHGDNRKDFTGIGELPPAEASSDNMKGGGLQMVDAEDDMHLASSERDHSDSNPGPSVPTATVARHNVPKVHPVTDKDRDTVEF